MVYPSKRPGILRWQRSVRSKGETVRVVRTSRLTTAAALFAVAVALNACSEAPVEHHTADAVTPCSQRASLVAAQNVDAISARRYALASHVAETSARISLVCATHESPSARFADRWRAANALVVAAELAHQGSQSDRARRLLAEGYHIMNTLRPPAHVSDLTSTLISQTRAGAERDMRGHWLYW